MIKIEKCEVYGFEAAVRGMRNPMNSWDKSDSFMCPRNPTFEVCNKRASLDRHCPRHSFDCECFCIGENDMKLMQNLVKAGTDHSKFMRYINVTCDVTAPLYWWKEYDTYKVGTVANSCSTMHKIHEKEFTLADFSCEWLSPQSLAHLQSLLDWMNRCRDSHLSAKEGHTQIDAVEAKDYWYQMIQLLPSSYNQRRTLQLNYAVLREMYHARRNHKLDEWQDFCEWVQNLPYAEELIGDGN